MANHPCKLRTCHTLAFFCEPNFFAKFVEKSGELTETNLNIDQLRSYASILSNSTFDKLVRQNNNKYVLSKSKRYDKEFIKFSNPTYKEYFEHIYNALEANYRNEYVYKNSIINKILLGKYSLNTTTAINEFRVGKSIADLVLLNGTSKVFEIKTELDNAERVINQLKDYKKVFKEIYLVTHNSLISKYKKIISSDIGLIALTENHSLKTIREAKENTNIENKSIIKCLRKVEFSNIIKKYFGELPRVSDFEFFKACTELIEKIPSSELHDLMMVELKKRNVKEKQALASENTPMELKHICLCLDFNKREYTKLSKILSKKLP